MTSMQREVLAHDLEQVEAAQARQLDVGDQHVDVFAIHQCQPGLGRRGAHDAVVAAKRLRKRSRVSSCGSMTSTVLRRSDMRIGV